MKCPRCGAEQEAASLECVRCGVVFSKLRAGSGGRRGSPAPPSGAELPVAADEERSWRELLGLSSAGETKISPAVFGGRVLGYLVFLVWGIRFLAYPVASPRMMESFLHTIDLVFHEAGHVLLMPLGWPFLTSLGGSLGQLAVPLVCAFVLLRKTRDPFGASICCWWTGQSLMDLAPYIADARALELVLLGGRTGAEVEGHDWEAILTALGWLQHDRTLGRLAHGVGALVILLSLAWGAAVLAQQRKRLERG